MFPMYVTNLHITSGHQHQILALSIKWHGKRQKGVLYIISIAINSKSIFNLF